MPTRDEPDERLALIIASSDYRDPTLQQLRAPGHDASDLATVLSDPAIGTFDVRTMINVPGGQLLRGIAQFCHQAGPGDLVLVYLSCHGVLDSRGRLYYASIDTERTLLSATALSAQWLSDQLDDCRARRQILLLDCCHSGAFARGSKGDDALALRNRFSGRGKVVLTASGATEYSFEGAAVFGEGVRSVFTRAVVDGLRTGQADRDKDGLITVDDLYHHVYDTVRATEPRQTPELWTFGAQGDLLVAYSPRGRIIEPAPLPEYVRALIENPRPVVRESGVKVLADFLDHGEPDLAQTARQTLHRISNEDIPRIAVLARAAYDAERGQAVAQLEAQDRAGREAEERVRRQSAEAHPEHQPARPSAPTQDSATGEVRETVLAAREQGPAPGILPSRDHVEVDLGPVAGVSDKGLRYLRNEDAMALGAEQTINGPTVLAVVCDGVSTSARPDDASQAAVDAALPVLTSAVRDGSDLAAASIAALTAGRYAVSRLTGPSGEISATTFVSIVAYGFEATICWLGNSRAYWLSETPSTARLLTQDDSAVAGGAAAGLVSEAAVAASPHAHVLTRWLGGEAVGQEGSPHVERFTPPEAGALLACSDGLWNYLPEAAGLSRIALPRGFTDPLGAAADLVKFAIDAGGADNITAVLIPYLGPETP